MEMSLKEILIKANEAISKNDHEGFLAYCTEDTEWNFIGDQVLKGKAAVRAWMKETYSNPPRVTVDQFISEGNSLAAIGTVAVKEQGGTYEPKPYCDVWQFRDGKLDRLKAFVV